MTPSNGGDAMSEGGSTPFTPAGGLTVDFVALLLLGRERGYLTPDDLISVMESVELTPALIAAAIGQVQAEGIEWRDDTELYSDTDLEEALDAGAGAFEVEADTGEDADPALVHNGVLSPDAVSDLDSEAIEAADTSEALARLARVGTGATGPGRLSRISASTLTCHPAAARIRCACTSRRLARPSC